MTPVRVSNRPLLDTRTDAELFVARDAELSRLRRALELGVNVLVHGAPGMGKTSLLRQLMWRERRSGRPAPRYVSGAAATSVAELLVRVARAFGSTEPGTAEDHPLDLLLRLGDAVKEIERPIVLLDEPDADLAYILFGRLRDEVWELPLGWVVAMDTADATRVLRPPADAFFEVRLEVPRLTAAELRELLLRRLPVSDDRESSGPEPGAPASRQPAALETGAGMPVRGESIPMAVLEELAATGDPRRALNDARALLTGEVSWAELQRNRRHRDEVVNGLGRPARMVVDALTRLGGTASASDPELLDLLGWTRPRAVQVLSKLEAAGVVASTTARRGGAGRPRKLYRLTGAVPA